MPTPPNFAFTLQLIQTLRSLPANGTPTKTGYTAAQIQAQHDALFPTTPLTLTQVDTLLRSGVANGVFLFGGCSNVAVTTPACVSGSTPTLPLANQLFFINSSMGSANSANEFYVAIGFMQNNDVQRIGYLPCGQCLATGGGRGFDPYSRASQSRFGTSIPVSFFGGGEILNTGGDCGTCLQ